MENHHWISYYEWTILQSVLSVIVKSLNLVVELSTHTLRIFFYSPHNENPNTTNTITKVIIRAVNTFINNPNLLFTSLIEGQGTGISNFIFIFYNIFLFL